MVNSRVCVVRDNVNYDVEWSLDWAVLFAGFMYQLNHLPSPGWI